MELSQLSVRIAPALITRLKMRAKEEKIPVNTLVTAMLETGLNDGGISAEFGRLKADPVSTLVKLHRKLCDPWETGHFPILSDAEIKFLAEGTRERINNTLLSGSYYDNIDQLARRPETLSSIADHRALLAFCVRHYIDDMNERMQFAKEQCPDNITTANYPINADHLAFTLSVTGTEFNRFITAEVRHPPVFSMVCKGNGFEAAVDWDVFTALVRLLSSLRQGEVSENRHGAAARLIKESGNTDQWTLLLGKLQLPLKQATLDKLAKEVEELTGGVLSYTFSQLLLVYGEG